MHDALLWVLLLFGFGLSLVVAASAVSGRWYFGLALILALPAAIALHKYPLYGLAIWLLLTPLVVQTDSGTIRMLYWLIHRAVPPVALGVLALTSWLKLNDSKFPKFGFVELSVIAYIGISLISIYYLNESPLATSYHLYDRVFIPFCLYLLTRSLVPTKRGLRRFMPVLVFVLICQSAIGILSWVLPDALPAFWTPLAGERTTGSLGSYSVFTVTIIFTSLLLLHYGLNERRGIARVGYVALFPLAMFMVFLSFSRGSWLAGLMTIAGLAYVYSRFIIRMIAVTVPILAILITLGLLGGQLDFARDRLNSHSTALDRLPVYYAGIQMFLAKPLFGWGYGNFDEYDREFQGRVLDLVNPAKDHASHNVYLTLLAEQGLVGFMLFMMPMFWWMAHTVRGKPGLEEEGLWSQKLLFVLWLFVLSAVVVNNFSNMRVVFGWGLWWIALGLISGALEPVSKQEPAQVSHATSGYRRASLNNS
jgi:O-antigen ligase